MSKRRPSPWVPLSVYYFDDAALMEAGEFAEVMFTRMMAYAGRHRDWNGRLPKQVVLSRLGLYALESVPESVPETRLERLRDSGLVSVLNGWVQIEGWLKWNEPGEKVESERQRDRGRKTAPTRDDSDSDPEDVPDSEPESAPDSRTSSRTVSRAQEKIRLEEKRATSAGAESRFDDFYRAYPRRVDRGHAEKAWKTATKNADPDTIVGAAERFAERSRGAEAKFIAHPATWLNGKRWLDEADEPASTGTWGFPGA